MGSLRKSHGPTTAIHGLLCIKEYGSMCMLCSTLVTSWAWEEQKRPKTQRPLYTPSEVSYTSNICFYWFRAHMNMKVEQYRGHGNG